MAKVLRDNRKRGVNLSFANLNALVKAKLHRLKYDQTPDLVPRRSDRPAGAVGYREQRRRGQAQPSEEEPRERRS